MSNNKTTSYAARVNIIKKVKVGWEWKFAPVAQDDKGRVEWRSVLINGQKEQHDEGTFYIDFYEDGRRKREAAGGTPSDVLESVDYVIS